MWYPLSSKKRTVNQHKHTRLTSHTEINGGSLSRGQLATGSRQLARRI
ncbi:MAG: hypothetical protein GTO45_37055 [Candidatus Aminicenantes bacterium]|nr:hypothetical protein [Candidatus Aminicenantes bacterium]NIN23762.1 hypothetical protein [Candidatus Aminicenantes bacterium]NIN47478.1 hypothetical protein [Candidatus Aminicenantes bacterium]NIN90398.1 hypothetical protein [Candidatus Aminicenantes bacterium]NIO87024.1 hypothetical protein [Candidatus Aminicenantes bacterium]